MELRIVRDTVQTAIRTLECLVKCTDRLYGVKEQYFILYFILYHVTSKTFSCHCHLLLLDIHCNSDMFLVGRRLKISDISILKHIHRNYC